MPRHDHSSSGDAEVTGHQCAVDQLLLGERRGEARVVVAARQSAGRAAMYDLRCTIYERSAAQMAGRANGVESRSLHRKLVNRKSYIVNRWARETARSESPGSWVAPCSFRTCSAAMNRGGGRNPQSAIRNPQSVIRNPQSGGSWEAPHRIFEAWSPPPGTLPCGHAS